MGAEVLPAHREIVKYGPRGARVSAGDQEVGCRSMATECLTIDVGAQEAEVQPFLEVAGLEGSGLRATRLGLTVLACPGDASDGGRAGRFWAYDQIRDVRVDEYGSLGVVRASIRSTGGEMPLLLLEPDQIIAARRMLEIVWNMMGDHDRRIDA